MGLDRGQRSTLTLIDAHVRAGHAPVTHAGVVGQAWRGGTRQARLARAIAVMHVYPLGRELAHQAGELLARSGTSDVIDAAVVLVSNVDDQIVTSDPYDLAHLATVAGRPVRLLAP